MTTIFIDDERFPTDPNNIILRSSSEAFDWVVKNGLPTHICFDHDLGGDDTSMVFLKRLTDWMLDNNVVFPHGFSYSVHSQNPIGRANIESWMDNLLTHIGVR